MKTPKEFDYDLWTTESGECFVRVKATGETTEVSVEVMRTLRAEEKAIRRAQRSMEADSLCLEENADGISGEWDTDCTDYAEIAETKVLDEQIQRLLTEKQLDIYLNCMKGGISYKDYANRKNVSYQSVQQAVVLIRKKASKIFF